MYACFLIATGTELLVTNVYLTQKQDCYWSWYQFHWDYPADATLTFFGWRACLLLVRAWGWLLLFLTHQNEAFKNGIVVWATPRLTTVWGCGGDGGCAATCKYVIDEGVMVREGRWVCEVMLWSFMMGWKLNQSHSLDALVWESGSPDGVTGVVGLCDVVSGSLSGVITFSCCIASSYDPSLYWWEGLEEVLLPPCVCCCVSVGCIVCMYERERG